MKPADEREEELFEVALERREGAERKAYLDQVCAGDKALRARLETLLEAHETNDSFLEAPAGFPGRTVPVSPPLTEKPGDHIGRYKLLQQIGEGGWGVVYVAEQEEPLRRRVALKVIKLGMDTKQVVARFEAERQALALMDHPNIAKVLDAGATDTGRPYFVMELVRGTKLTNYCDEHCLSTEQRLNLFAQVCHAIQHAHQKEIIHRDIKPSNILVTVNDGVAVPKVIDFGIAKAIGPQLTDKTVYTAFEQFIGTPAYVSPEQASMTSLDIDTRSDIYALGVLLYELLTGHTPFEQQELIAAGLDEMRRIIREREPARPSARVSTLAGDEQTTVAKRRHADPPQLLHLLRGDLDWIVMKCLEKERSRRYETPNELADDLTRYLGDEPIKARPPGVVYRLEKSIRRNRLAWGAATTVCLALVLAMLSTAWQAVVVLVVGVMVSTWQAVRARRAARREATARIQADQAAGIAASQRERADKERERARASELAAREQAYAADMSLTQQALAMNDLGSARRLLESYRRRPGERDLRGWEWRYLWRQCRSDVLSELCRYPGWVTQVDYAPDGATLAVAGWHPEFLDLWSVSDRRKLVSLPAADGSLVTFSPRGDLLAADTTQGINIWRAGTSNLVRQLADPGGFRLVRALRFSPGGTWLAAANKLAEVIVWNVDGWSISSRVPGPLSTSRFGFALAFSPDEKALAVGSGDGSVSVIDPRTGTRNLTITAHPELVTALAWSPGAAILASGSGFSGGPIRLWDATSGRPLGALEGHTSWICRLLFSKDGQRLYSAGADQTIRIWDVPQQKCLAVLRGSSAEVHGLALSPDGSTLASGCKDGVVAFWNALPPLEEREFGSPFIPDGRVAAIATGGVKYAFAPTWSPGHRLKPVASGGLNYGLAPAFAPDSRVIAVASGELVRLYALPALREVDSIPPLGTHAIVAAYSPDGQVLASGSTDGWVRFWSCTDRRLLKELHGPEAGVMRLSFSADGTRILSSGIEGGEVRVICWDLTTWQRISSFVVAQLDHAYSHCVSISPNGRVVISGDSDGKLSWWDTATGKLLSAINAQKVNISAVAFSPDGKRAASASEDGMVALWDASLFKPIATFKCHMQAAVGVVFSPDGQRLATGGLAFRDAVKLWDLRTYRELLTLHGEGMSFIFLSFSPDGNWLAAINNNRALQIWRAPTWAEIEAAEKDVRNSTPANRENWGTI